METSRISTGLSLELELAKRYRAFLGASQTEDNLQVVFFLPLLGEMIQFD